MTGTSCPIDQHKNRSVLKMTQMIAAGEGDGKHTIEGYCNTYKDNARIHPLRLTTPTVYSVVPDVRSTALLMGSPLSQSSGRERSHARAF